MKKSNERDPNRIAKIMSKLEYLWHYHPELRFWQLICLLCSFLPKNFQEDPFYCEDDKWLMAIEYAIAEAQSEKDLSEL